jgi:hypothetical protein
MFARRHDTGFYPQMTADGPPLFPIAASIDWRPSSDLQFLPSGVIAWERLARRRTAVEVGASLPIGAMETGSWPTVPPSRTQ